MNPEQLLLGGLSAVTTVLSYIARLLWKEMQECKRDRIFLRQEVEDLRRSQGRLDIMERCSLANCPFRNPSREPAEKTKTK